MAHTRPLWLACATFYSFAAADDSISMYFGAGCFWHVQHELILAEHALLGRQTGNLTKLFSTGPQGFNLTAVVGYAGGTEGSFGEVCYTNYGRMGHTEVVQVRDIPLKAVSSISGAFGSLFQDSGDRVDTQDVGSSYRAAIGFPGGVSNEKVMKAVKAGIHKVQPQMGFAPGKGGDPDTLGTGIVYVYDSSKFPFFQAEIYHQFHDDMIQRYGKSYHFLKNVFIASGSLKDVTCPSQSMALLYFFLRLFLPVVGVCLVLIACYLCYKRWKIINRPKRQIGSQLLEDDQYAEMAVPDNETMAHGYLRS